MTPADLRWTGHALVDVGLAGICAFANRKRPEEVTLEDLDSVSRFLVETYYREDLVTYLSCVFMNSSFVQPNEGAEKRRFFFARYLQAHRADPDPQVAGQRCVFSGLPATSPLVRTHLPLFSGEGVMNYRPGGTTWVPAAGPFIVALFFLPMASRRAEGKLLCVHADAPAVTLRFARRYLEDNKRLISLALPTERTPTHAGYDRELAHWDASRKRYKFADVKGPRSLVIADLADIGAQTSDFDSQISPLSVYLLSNSGQGPSLNVFDVPSGVVSFVLRASGASTRDAWVAVTSRFRPIKATEDGERGQGPLRRSKQATTTIAPKGRPGWSKNPAFEDLCAIYENGFLDRGVARAWLSRYVFGRVRPGARNSRLEGTNARTWALAELFLKEVLGMKQSRIDAIRTFADKLAEHIRHANDKALYRSLVMDKLSDLRRVLMRAQRESAKGKDLLFGLNEYATVWLHEDGDEWLVRDLICIRVVEVLAARDFFAVHPTLVPEELTETEETIQ